MSDKTRHAIAARLAANRKATGVAIREPRPAPKKAKPVVVEPEPIEEPVEIVEAEEEQGGTEG